jgi:rfaE bifunctional protein kinase chain/domain
MPDIPTAERLLQLTEEMAGRPVLMVVDLVADRYITGSPKRISREAPVLILRYEGESWALGGGANAVANVRSLGGEPLPIGVLGDDEAANRLRGCLEAIGVTTEGLLVQQGYSSPTKTRLMAGDHAAIKQQVARFDIESHSTLGEAEIDQYREHLARWKDRASIAVMSDYGYGSVEPGLLADVQNALREPRGVLCDSRYRLASFAGVEGATPNQEEAEALAGRPLDGDEELLARTGKELRERLQSKFLLITRGSLGMALFEDGALTEIPVHGTRQVADVTGAGDTVIGTLALARAAGASPVEATLLANYAAGIVVRKPGTAVPTMDELQGAIRTDPAPLAQARRRSL